MKFVTEPEKKIPVINEVDVCVLGGSCTGVFAAIRAARLGAKVAIVEKQNCFGGTATSGVVNRWHSLENLEYNRQIIAGLTQEVIERLKKRGAVSKREKVLGAYDLNTEELKIELDELVMEHGIAPYLHTVYAAPYVKDGKLEAVYIENKSGRCAIKADVFIDATGDGDLCRDLDIPCYYNERIQPPTLCGKMYGLDTLGDFDYRKAFYEHGDEFKLDDDWGWSASIPNIPDFTMWSETHVWGGVNCADADDLTYSEIEGRRQVRAQMDIIRKYGPLGNKVALVDLASYIGIQEARHVMSRYRLKTMDILNGVRFDDAIANGTYRLDIHYNNRSGILFRYLDGTQEDVFNRITKSKKSMWREEIPVDPTFYQIPYRSMVPGIFGNVIMAGRMLDADEGAFGAVRVMVNMNQMGEAAGVASYLALNSGVSFEELDVKKLRKALEDGGTIII